MSDDESLDLHGQVFGGVHASGLTAPDPMLNDPPERLRETYSIEFARLERSKLPVAQIVWRTSTGDAVLAQHSVGEWNIELHRSAATQQDRDLLLLNAVALHQWWHIRTGD